MVLQGPTWFRSNASKLRFEPWYGFQAAGFWEQTAPETLTSFGSFLARGSSSVVPAQTVLRLSWKRCFAAAEE